MQGKVTWARMHALTYFNKQDSERETHGGEAKNCGCMTGLCHVLIEQVVNNSGGWLNYIATLSTIERLAGQRGLLVSLVVIVRLLPSLLLFPITGVVADRCALEHGGSSKPIQSSSLRC